MAWAAGADGRDPWERERREGWLSAGGEACEDLARAGRVAREGCLASEGAACEGEAEGDGWLMAVGEPGDPGATGSIGQVRRWVGIWVVIALIIGAGAGFALGRRGWQPVSSKGDPPVAGAVDAGNPEPPAGGEQAGGAMIVVDVHGDVRRPGVYSLPFGARVKDAVAAAGGYRDPADAEEVNAAAPLDDGAEVVVPRHNRASGGTAASGGRDARPSGDSGGSGSAADPASLAGDSPLGVGGPTGGAGAAGPAGARIDLNTATAATLETLPGIGPARASAIVSYREQHGPFPDLESLQQVPGIGPVTWAKISPYLYVASP